MKEKNMCPQCGSVSNVYLLSPSRKAGIIIGGLAGCIISTLRKSGLPGILTGFLTGATAGNCVGKYLDKHLIAKYKCGKCSKTFNR